MLEHRSALMNAQQKQERILEALLSCGFPGATTNDLCAQTGFERHTLTKHLSALEADGQIAAKAVGNAQLWYGKSAATYFMAHAFLAQESLSTSILLGLIAETPAGTCLVHADNSIVFADAAFQSRYGETRTKKIAQVLFRKPAVEFMASVRSVLQGEPTSALSVRDRFGALITLTITRLESSSNTYAMIHCTDQTKRIQLRKEIRTLGALMQQTDELVCVTDVQGNILSVNERFCEVTGYTAQEVIGKNPRILKSGAHHKDYYAQLWNCILAGKVYKSIAIDKKKNGELYREEKTITPIMDENRRILFFVSIGRAISDPYLAAAKKHRPKTGEKYE